MATDMREWLRLATATPPACLLLTRQQRAMVRFRAPRQAPWRLCATTSAVGYRR